VHRANKEEERRRRRARIKWETDEEEVSRLVPVGTPLALTGRIAWRYGEDIKGLHAVCLFITV
jgi:hypothetical protein